MKKLAEPRKQEHEEKNKSSQLLFGEYARELAVDANTGASKFPILVFARARTGVGPTMGENL